MYGQDFVNSIDALDPGVMLFDVYRLEEEVGSMLGREELPNSSAIHPSILVEYECPSYCEPNRT
jgi:hypothetical protein